MMLMVMTYESVMTINILLYKKKYNENKYLHMRRCIITSNISLMQENVFLIIHFLV